MSKDEIFKLLSRATRFAGGSDTEEEEVEQEVETSVEREGRVTREEREVREERLRAGLAATEVVLADSLRF